jgi:hypothetical protein
LRLNGAFIIGEGDEDGIHGSTQSTPRKRKTSMRGGDDEDDDDGTPKQKKSLQQKRKAKLNTDAKVKEEDSLEDGVAEESA